MKVTSYRTFLGVAVLAWLIFPSALTSTVDAAQDRNMLVERLLQEIKRDAYETRNYTGTSTINERVLNAMKVVPREAFVPSASTSAAYLNRPLSIGHGQTISQPFIVALMTDLLELSPGDRVLEIGTGSGYQAAVLAELGAEVYTIEIIPELAASAGERLAKIGYVSVKVKTGDGRLGWPQAAPFDSIIVTAVGEQLPPRLLEQLKPGGILVMPVGQERGNQQLMQVRKPEDPQAKLVQRSVLPVVFVPLTGDDSDNTRN